MLAGLQIEGSSPWLDIHDGLLTQLAVNAVSGSPAEAVNSGANMWPLQHGGVRAVGFLPLISSRARVRREPGRMIIDSQVTEHPFYHAVWV